ncbi:MULTISPECIES: isopentenyl-diphosphate Delta-isomerase [unclassified Corynebacterium]|uniref:isopentenyl-diphosphate Delta-isomerase n=1 Tax=unclassified Corynebacterium TaxID=2624378 RepID=UPI0029CA0639|nr:MULTISPECIES: isopentenyl-diphosphate Delta-isomerase [unclassified Corynebacterium]WPF65557.1 isopentenyl-diphosphate Delta-isomerase [Corynebacterium sp. 22KM0430]WPF68052.1 isopentenyl-diphosphate Delta-isomerase [Corynebacterium sp. 21KM1197]
MISTGSAEGRELVILSDEEGNPTGTVPKESVHTEDTPLHLAFSAYLVDPEGRVLLTRRALSKKTWPGVWTNSFCGHPAPGEATEDAVRRRLEQELGVSAAQIMQLSRVLPDFRYWARDSSGVVENEICPVFVVRLAAGSDLRPSPAEVDSWEWLRPSALVRAVEAAPVVFSPWLVEQLAHSVLQAELLGVH